MTRESTAARVHDVVVPPEWIDFNGHVNDSRHFQMTSETVDRFMELIGVNEAYRAGGHSWFTVESHLRFHAQAYLGDHLEGAVQLLQHDGKRLHMWCSVWRGTALVCSAEHLLLHVDTTTNRVTSMPTDMLQRFASVAADQASLERPDRIVLDAFRGR